MSERTDGRTDRWIGPPFEGGQMTFGDLFDFYYLALSARSMLHSGLFVCQDCESKKDD